MEIGDIVARKSYNSDVFFRVTHILDENLYSIVGINYRLKIYAEESDLVPIRVSKIKEFKKIFREDMEKRSDNILEQRNQTPYNQNELKPGKVLHIDADREYLKLCMEYYKILEVPAVGEKISEIDQPEKMADILKEHMPDILVITGHDSLSDRNNSENIDNYKSSKYFIETVKAARWVNPSKDSLIIIAGACQSHYEGLIEAGANIASSPERILIHALDPLFVAEKVSYTPVGVLLSLEELLKNTITGNKGLGGFQTRGTLREGKEIK